jgi:hypothetical protein
MLRAAPSGHRYGTLLIAALAALLARSAPVCAQLCTGDCNDDGAVTIGELVRGVSIALATQPLASCPAFDASGDDTVSINEIIAAIGFALRGCPAGPTSTPAAIATPTPTMPTGNEPVSFFDHAEFAAAAPGATVIGFDTVPAQTILSGTEFDGVTIAARRLTVVDPRDFAPGLIVGFVNINSQPNGLSVSLFYSGGRIAFDDGNDDVLVTFTQPVGAAGLWLGNLGASDSDPFTTTTVSFRDRQGNPLATDALTQAHVGLIGSGANNRIFYGITSAVAIRSIAVSNSAADGDGIILDDLQFLPAPGGG